MQQNYQYTILPPVFKSPICKVRNAVVNYSFAAIQLSLSLWIHFPTAEAVFLAIRSMIPYAIKYVSATNGGMARLADDVAVLTCLPSLREETFYGGAHK